MVAAFSDEEASETTCSFCLGVAVSSSVPPLRCHALSV